MIGRVPPGLILAPALVLLLPAVRLGQVDLLPAVLFAIALQTQARRLTLRLP